MKNKKILIAGGGPVGLILGYKLAKAGAAPAPACRHRARPAGHQGQQAEYGAEGPRQAARVSRGNASHR